DGEILFVGHPRLLTSREALEQIRAAVGRPGILVPIPRPFVSAASLIGDISGALTGRPALLNRHRYVELYAEGFACRVDRLRDRLGIVAKIDVTEGFAEAARWYRENGWL